MPGASVLILLFGLGLLGLAWLSGGRALAAARDVRRRETLLAGAGAAVLTLAGLLAVAEGLARLLLR